MPYKPDGSPPPRGRCPKDREGLLIIMKNKDLWRNIIQVVVSILTAALTALGTTSCMSLMSIWKVKIGEGCSDCDLFLLKKSFFLLYCAHLSVPLCLTNKTTNKPNMKKEFTMGAGRHPDLRSCHHVVVERWWFCPAINGCGGSNQSVRRVLKLKKDIQK